ncbi:MAG: hypothetical protein AB7K24_18455 [Gemmataceae bacterium]
MSRSVVHCGLALILASGMVLSSRGADQYLTQQQQLQAIQAQKILYQVRGILLKADNLAATQPKEAADLLERTITALERDTNLPKEKRDSMISMLSARIKSLKAAPDPKALDEKAVQAAIRAANKEEVSKEDQALQNELNTILDLQAKGKVEEAQKMAAELARKHPSNQAVRIANHNTSALNQLASARTIRQEKERGFDGAIRDVEKSATPIKGDIQFPDAEKWKRINERAKKYTGPRLTPQEQSIMAALNKPLPSLQFKDASFKDVIEYLATQMGQPILVDQAALRDAQIGYDSTVNLSIAKGISARTVLRKVLADFGLAYIVKDQAIQVTTLEKARATMSVRAYPVADLISLAGGPGDPAQNFFGPGIGPVARMQSVAALMQMVQSTVDPGSWQANGGQGAIYFDYNTMSIVIKQTAEVHAAMGNTFGR